jgi:ankyrin repeat protein
VSQGNGGIVRRLLQCVTPHTVNMASGSIRNTALHFIIDNEAEANLLLVDACVDGNIDAAANIFHVSNINLQVVGGLTALHLASMQGYVDIVRMLLSAFASTDVTDNNLSYTSYGG